MRLSSDDILKPGAKLNVERIDFDDPKNSEIKKLFEETRKRQIDLKKSLEWTQEDYNSMRNVITI